MRELTKNSTKHIRPLAVVLLLALTLLTGCSANDSADDASSDIYDFPVTTLDGETSTLADYAGEPLVVNFFAAWCPPCRRELPDFDAVAQANADEVTIVGVSHDLDEATWRGLLDETGITFPTVFEPEQQIYKSIGGNAMPTTIFVNSDGEVVDKFAGALSEEKLQELIDTNLLASANTGETS